MKPMPVRLVALLTAGLSACSGTATPAASPTLDQLFSQHVRIVDLTHAVSAESPYWPGTPSTPFRHDTLSRHADGSPSMAAYHLPEHFGTHLDAPIHSAEGQPSVDLLSPAALFGPAVVIDLAEESARNPDYELTDADVRDWEREHGQIPAGAVVLMRTGWDARWSNPAEYRNADAEGRMHFPGFSASAATFLVEQRDIRGIGIDDFSVDPASAGTFPVHRIVNGSGKYHLENLANLDSLPPVGAYLIVAPIKIEGGSGGQVRVFALIPRPST